MNSLFTPSFPNSPSPISPPRSKPSVSCTRASVRCAYPSFWAHQHAKRGAARLPVNRSFAASYSSPKNQNNLFPETKCFPSGPNSGRQGHISFHWSKLHPTDLHCTLLSYAATSRATLCPILSYAAPCWATMQPTKLCCIQLSYVAPYLSYDAP
jgi:hypothetical protein